MQTKFATTKIKQYWGKWKSTITLNREFIKWFIYQHYSMVQKDGPFTKQESRIKGVEMRYLRKCMRKTRRHSCPLKMEPIVCSEMSERNYHYLLCINPKKYQFSSQEETELETAKLEEY